MSPPIDRPKHAVWDVFSYLLGHQIRQTCALSKPTIDIDDDDLADMLHHLIGNLARGYNMKEIYRTVDPCLKSQQQRAIFSELCRWIFSTQGVLSTLYQPFISQNAEAEDQNTMEEVVVQANEGKYNMSRNGHVQILLQNSNLFRLPNELLDNVLSNLSALDVNDLRMTCRQARMRSFPFWSKTFFSTRQFMIDEHSLQTLLDISQHPQLSNALTHLVIGVDEIDTKDTLDYIKRSRTRSPRNLPSLFRYWHDAASAQQALLNTGRAIDLLSTAVSNLPNLDHVSVSGSKLFRHVPYYDKVFHCPDLGMRSYGSTAYQMQPRYGTSGRPNSKGFIDRVFNVVLNSLARSSPNITTFRTNLSRDDTLDHLDDEAFNLLPLAHMNTSATSVLGGLSELHLDISLESQLVEKVEHLADHDHTFDTSNFGLRNLLTLTCNLQSLSLTLFGGETMEGHCDFTAWLCEPANGYVKEADEDEADSESPSSIAWSPPPIALPSLRRLVLQGLFMSPEQLRAIFTKFESLKSAALFVVYLRRCFLDAPPVPENSDQMENLWATFFRGSSAALANLDSLELDNLAVMQYREDPDDGVAATAKDVDLVVFEPEQGSGKPPPSFKTVTDFGKGALKKLARETLLGREVIVAVDPGDSKAEDSS